ncbi:hypothetical protein ABOM_002244 [Aspergillus bombycis]|uniref:Zn(II)2Cys6 transcription factor n=1 Tax=Aspergillus bombycis TaxID=109264 RepID=A0A1F8ACS7_9EURO|nr:hypothetical protein ABOM_002244 [Aspergillus bombycis]OGM49165.1 hypothetical protein ABOM_002244 [Aspergillus bombycis]
MEDGAQKFTRRPKALLNGPRTHQVDQVGPGIPQLNTNVEVRSQLFQSFIDRYLPQSQYICDRTGKNILQTLPDLSGSSLLLDKAVVALSTAFLAKQNQDRRLLQNSTEIYGNAIRMLNGKISSRRALGKDVLYTTIIFQIYELINCSPPGFGAWIAHVQGSSAVINQCSGQDDETVASRLFRRQLKFVTLCDAIGKRKAPDWYNPSTGQDSSLQDTDSPEPIDELIDRLADCSALMERVDSFLQEGAEGHDQIQNTGRELLLSCFSLEEKLHRICCMTQKELGKPSALVPANVTCRKDFRSSLFTDVLPKPFQFPSLTCAEAHLIYWTALVLLYPLIDQLLEVLEPADRVSLANCYSTSGEDAKSRVTPNSEITTDFTALAEHYADQVCRSVIYCLQRDLKTLGAQLLLAPLSQSAQFYSVHEIAEKYRWCQGVFVLLPQLGLGIGYFLKDMVWPKYRSSQRKRLSPTSVSPE